MDQLQRAAVGGPRVLGAIEPAEQLRAGRVQVVVAVEIEVIDEGEGGLDVACLCDGGGPVQLHHR